MHRITPQERRRMKRKKRFLLITESMLILVSVFLIGYLIEYARSSSNKMTMGKKISENTMCEEIVYTQKEYLSPLTEYKTYSYYKNQLQDERDKELYDRIYDAIISNYGNDYDYYDDETATIVQIPIEDMEYVFESERNKVHDVYAAVMYDHPELFYLSESITACGCGVTTDGTQSVGFVRIYSNSDYASVESRNSVYEIFDKNIEELKSECENGSVADICQNVSKKVMENVTYATLPDGTPDNNQHTRSAVCLEEGYGVCSGYSKAEQLFLNQLDVPNIYAVGLGNVSRQGEAGNHAWNMVAIDGYWYGIDTTWEDSEEGNWLLKGEEKFNDTHWGEYDYPAVYIEDYCLDCNVNDTSEDVKDISVKEKDKSKNQSDIPIVNVEDGLQQQECGKEYEGDLRQECKACEEGLPQEYKEEPQNCTDCEQGSATQDDELNEYVEPIWNSESEPTGQQEISIPTSDNQENVPATPIVPVIEENQTNIDEAQQDSDEIPENAYMFSDDEIVANVFKENEILFESDASEKTDFDYLIRGTSLENQGDYEGALEAYNHVEDELTRAQSAAMVYQRMENYGKAAEMYEQAYTASGDEIYHEYANDYRILDSLGQ